MPPDVDPDDELSWSVFQMFGRQWLVGGFGGLIGWGGYESAILVLVHGYRVTGFSLVVEVERLREYEAYQLEMEAARLKKKKDNPNESSEGSGGEKVEGDLADFYTSD